MSIVVWGEGEGGIKLSFLSREQGKERVYGLIYSGLLIFWITLFSYFKNSICINDIHRWAFFMLMSLLCRCQILFINVSLTSHT